MKMNMKKNKEKPMKARMIFLSLSTLILGGLAGASVGMLFAPRSGRATRAMLRSKGVELQERVSEDITLAGAQVMGRVDNLATDARHKVGEIGGQLKESVSSISLPFPTNGH